MLSALAPVKINLCLHVGALRRDGLHDLASLAAILPLGDDLKISPSDELRLEIDGLFASELSAYDREENLVMRAARRLQRAGDSAAGAHILLTKNMPVAAGLGAGTADAATVLYLLRDLWRVQLSDEALLALAFELGADGPLCLLPHLTGCGSVVVHGAGEHVAPGPALPPAWVCVVNPGEGVSTAEVFACYDRATPAEITAIPDMAPDMQGLAAFIRTTRNDLERPAMSLCPKIDAVLRLLAQSEGCVGVRMSGSGATCFGLYPTRQEAAATAAAAAENGWWYGVAPLRESLLEKAT